MGKQSSRLYYQGKDHKEIYFRGHYHDAMYVGSQLVWEKIYEEPTELWLDEINSNAEHIKSDYCFMYPDGTVAFLTGHIFALNRDIVLFSGGKLDGKMAETESSIGFRLINGSNFGIYDDESLLLFVPEQNIFHDKSEITRGSYYGGYINGVFINEESSPSPGGISYIDPFTADVGGSALRLKEHMYIDGNEVDSSVVHPWPLGTDYILNHMYVERDSFQWFNGKLYAHLYYRDNVDYGTCSTSDGFRWTSGEPIVGRGKVVNNILFLNNGVAVDANMDIVAYTKMPAFFWNNFYYASQTDEDGYLLRSKDLIQWEKYRKIKKIRNAEKYNILAYCSEKRYLCIYNWSRNDYVYKLRINL